MTNKTAYHIFLLTLYFNRIEIANALFENIAFYPSPLKEAIVSLLKQEQLPATLYLIEAFIKRFSLTEHKKEIEVLFSDLFTTLLTPQGFSEALVLGLIDYIKNENVQLAVFLPQLIKFTLEHISYTKQNKIHLEHIIDIALPLLTEEQLTALKAQLSQRIEKALLQDQPILTLLSNCSLLSIFSAAKLFTPTQRSKILFMAIKKDNLYILHYFSTSMDLSILKNAEAKENLLHIAAKESAPAIYYWLNNTYPNLSNETNKDKQTPEMLSTFKSQLNNKKSNPLQIPLQTIESTLFTSDEDLAYKFYNDLLTLMKSLENAIDMNLVYVQKIFLEYVLKLALNLQVMNNFSYTEALIANIQEFSAKLPANIEKSEAISIFWIQIGNPKAALTHLNQVIKAHKTPIATEDLLKHLYRVLAQLNLFMYNFLDMQPAPSSKESESFYSHDNILMKLAKTSLISLIEASPPTITVETVSSLSAHLVANKLEIKPRKLMNALYIDQLQNIACVVYHFNNWINYCDWFKPKDRIKPVYATLHYILLETTEAILEQLSQISLDGKKVHLAKPLFDTVQAFVKTTLKESFEKRKAIKSQYALIDFTKPQPAPKQSRAITILKSPVLIKKETEQPAMIEDKKTEPKEDKTAHKKTSKKTKPKKPKKNAAKKFEKWCAKQKLKLDKETAIAALWKSWHESNFKIYPEDYLPKVQYNPVFSKPFGFPAHEGAPHEHPLSFFQQFYDQNQAFMAEKLQNYWQQQYSEKKEPLPVDNTPPLITEEKEKELTSSNNEALESLGFFANPPARFRFSGWFEEKVETPKDRERAIAALDLA